jgi:superoxide dismutase, Cu-Zn family
MFNSAVSFSAVTLNRNARPLPLNYPVVALHRSDRLVSRNTRARATVAPGLRSLMAADSMSRVWRRITSASALFVALCVSSAHAQAPPAASAQLRDASGQLVATATFNAGGGYILITLAFPQRNLTGTHALHIHDGVRCQPPDFASAGGIFNPLRREHGLLNPDGPMAGDLPNIVLGERGLASYNLSTPLVTLEPGPTSLLRPEGTSLVIGAGVDDDASQPDGNSGARLACGPIVGGPASGALPLPNTPSDQDGSSTRLVLAALGVMLIGAGVVLRRRPATSARP